MLYLLASIMLLVLASIELPKYLKDEPNSVGASHPPLVLDDVSIEPTEVTLCTDNVETISPTVEPTPNPTEEPISTQIVTESSTIVLTPEPTVVPTYTPTPSIEISSRGEYEYAYKITALGTAYTNGNDGWGNQVLWSGGVNYLPTFQDVPGIPTKNELVSMYNDYIDNHAGQYGYKNGELHTRWGIVAVDPRVIPLGTAMYIESCDDRFPDYGYAIAVDIGGFIRRNSYNSIQNNDYTNLRVVDMWMETETQCYNWGVRPVNIYILEDQTSDIFKLREEG